MSVIISNELAKTFSELEKNLQTYSFSMDENKREILEKIRNNLHSIIDFLFLELSQENLDVIFQIINSKWALLKYASKAVL